MNEVGFVGHFALVRCVNALRRDNYNVLPEQDVDEHVNNERQHQGIDEEGDIAERWSRSYPVYSGSTYDDARHTLRKALEKIRKTI